MKQEILNIDQLNSDIFGRTYNDMSIRDKMQMIINADYFIDTVYENYDRTIFVIVHKIEETDSSR